MNETLSTGLDPDATEQQPETGPWQHRVTCEAEPPRRVRWDPRIVASVPPPPGSSCARGVSRNVRSGTQESAVECLSK